MSIQMEIIDDFIRIPVMKRGTIYHYTSLQAVFGIIDKQEFWATKSDFLNDYDELVYTVRLFREIFIDSNVFIDIELKKRILEAFDRHIEEDRCSKEHGYYILSFSSVEDNLTLWAEFSDSMGYNIGFDIEQLIKSISIKHKLLWHGSVVYSKEEQIELLKKVIEESAALRLDKFGISDISQLNNNLSDEQVDLIGIDLFVACSAYSMFFKHPLFEAEKEYRIVVSGIHKAINGSKIDELLYRDRQGAVIPYIKVPHNPIASIRSIMLGPKNTSDISVNGIKLYCTRKELNNVQINKSFISLRY